MSVLIDMKMPASCRVCALSQPDGVGWICPIVTGRPVVDSRLKTRHPRCPLVEIPAHGRLIDADALEELGFHAAFAYTGKMPYEYEFALLASVPTVIQAEEAES